MKVLKTEDEISSTQPQKIEEEKQLRMPYGLGSIEKNHLQKSSGQLSSFLESNKEEEEIKNN